MAAQVSSFIRNLNCHYFKDDQQPMIFIADSTAKSTALITQDLLGSSSISSNVDDGHYEDGDSHDDQLDLDSQVPHGWEKRLDLKSGKVYIQRRSTSPNSSTQVPNLKNQTVMTTKLQEFNLLCQDSSSSSPSSSSPLSTLFNYTNLDLKLVSSSSYNNQYQSACTLDKVKFALDRAESDRLAKKRSSQLSSNSSGRLLFAAGCPNCLIYIMISKTNPRCPRCNSFVSSSPAITKKPRIDLNLSI